MAARSRGFLPPGTGHINRPYPPIGVRIESLSRPRGEVDDRITRGMPPQMPHHLPTLQIPERNGGESPPTSDTASAATPKQLDDNARLQLVFDNELKDLSGTGRPHKACAVLMISWDDELDDLGTSKEINELGEIFEDLFNFKVVKKRILKDHRSPQVQVQKILGDFVYDYDSPVTLLIVYYAGHGIPGERGLSLAGKRTPKDTEETQKRSAILWHQAEHLIRSATADILVIFDCCYAGNIAKGMRGIRSRNFEFLGACQGDRETPVPGPTSFTSALIWALKDLIERKTYFTIQELLQTIAREAPQFPANQFPYYCERDEHCVDRLVLAAIPEDVEACYECDFAAPNDTTAETQDEYLDLRFCFKEKPQEDHIKQLAEALKHLVLYEKIKVHNVRWIGLPNLEKVRFAASNWLRRTIKREIKQAIAVSESLAPKQHMAQVVQTQTPFPSPRKRSEEPDIGTEHVVSSEPSEHRLDAKGNIEVVKRKNDNSAEAQGSQHSKRQRL